MKKAVLILGANSDVAKAMIPLLLKKGYHVMAASRNIEMLQSAFQKEKNISFHYFDAVLFHTHMGFYDDLPYKPMIVIYAAGYLMQNLEVIEVFSGALQMIQVHYAGAVSILNIIINDKENKSLKRIIGLSSLSGVRGRKSNFIYGSSKAAFTQYMAGLRQHLFARKIEVNVVVAGYIRSKMTAGLELPEHLMLEPGFVARAALRPTRKFIIVPGWKWKLIYLILKWMPERLVARLP